MNIGQSLIQFFRKLFHMKSDTVEVYKDGNKEWRWRRIRAGNYKVVGASEEGYKRKGYCERMAKQKNPRCTVVVVE